MASKKANDFLLNGFGAISNIILGLCLIGSFTYILWGASNEKDTIEKRQQILNRTMVEREFFTSMLSTPFKDTLNSYYDVNILDTLNRLLNELEKYRGKIKIPKTLRSDIYSLCDSAINRFTVEKGKLTGYIFEKKLYQSRQNNFIDSYVHMIDLINNYKSLVSIWGDRPQEKPVIHNMKNECLKLHENYAAFKIIYDMEMTEDSIICIEYAQEYEQVKNGFSAITK